MSWNKWFIKFSCVGAMNKIRATAYLGKVNTCRCKTFPYIITKEMLENIWDNCLYTQMQSYKTDLNKSEKYSKANVNIKWHFCFKVWQTPFFILFFVFIMNYNISINFKISLTKLNCFTVEKTHWKRGNSAIFQTIYK